MSFLEHWGPHMPRLKELAETTRDAFMIDPRKIVVDQDYNLRDLSTPDAVESLGQLAESIKESGVRVPLLVRLDGEEIILVQGHRRLAAIMSLIKQGTPFAAVQCFSEEKKRSIEDRTLDLFLSNDGEPLTQLEKAEGVARLLSYGWDEDKIAQRLGRSTSYVRHLHGLESELPERIKTMVRDGQVAAATALKTVKKEGAEAGTQILEDARADAEAEARASDKRPPIVAAANSEPAPRAKKVTEKRIAKTREKRSGIAPQPKAGKSGRQNMGTLYDALFVHINKFLGKCMDGTYENSENEVPQRLHDDAKDLAESIKLTRAGFREQEQEAAE